jgi:hypothetical protein
VRATFNVTKVEVSLMKMKLRLVVMLCALCCVCGGVASAQSSKGEQPTPIVPVQTQHVARVVEDASAPAGWKRYEVKYGSGDTVSFVFPQTPDESDSKADVPNSGTVVVHLLTAASTSGTYLAGYMEFFTTHEVKITPDVRDLIFDGFWKNFSTGMQTQMEKLGVSAKITANERRKITISGREGLEQDFTVGNMTGRYRAVAGDHNIYMIVAFTPGADSPKERDDFIESLKITPQP